MNWTRVNNDYYGNPRHVVHYLECCPFEGASYAETVRAMNKIGGRKYHTKQYGGGIVFSFYNQSQMEAQINEIKNHNN